MKLAVRHIGRLVGVAALICVCLTSERLAAQGFDWQYDARMPSDYPTLFFGLDAAFGASSYNGELQHSEKLLDPLDGTEICRDCGIFDSGEDQYLRLGLRGEYWLDGLWVVRLGAAFVRIDMSAEAPTPDLPSLEYGPINTELQFESTRHRAQIDIGARRRVLDKFSLSAGLSGGYLLSEKIEQRHQIIAPAEAHWTIDGENLTSRVVEGELSEAADFVLAAEFGMHYDVPLARGLYAVTGMTVAVPITSVTADQSWRNVGLRFGVSILYGRW